MPPKSSKMLLDLICLTILSSCQVIRTRYTLGPETTHDPYHVNIIKEKLMRTLPAVLPDVIDELTYAVPDYIPATGDGNRLIVNWVLCIVR